VYVCSRALAVAASMLSFSRLNTDVALDALYSTDRVKDRATSAFMRPVLATAPFKVIDANGELEPKAARVIDAEEIRVESDTVKVTNEAVVPNSGIPLKVTLSARAGDDSCEKLHVVENEGLV